jgi:hypothetical protein
MIGMSTWKNQVKVWLGGHTKNTFKGQSRSKNWPNNIPRPFPLNVFIIIIFFFMFISCMSKYMAWNSITIKKRWKSLQICIPSLQEITIYLIGKLNKKPIILTFGQFDHLVILNKSIWTCPTWLMVFFINHKMVFWIS